MAFNMTLDQEEIEKAIDIHVRSLVPGLAPETKIGISLSATRGPSGFTAAIDLNPTETAAVATAAASAPKEEAPKAAPVKVKTSGTKPLNIAAKAAEAKATPAKEAAPEAAPEAPAETITQTSDTAELPVEQVTETAVADVTTADVSAEEEAARAADAMDLNAPVEEAQPEAEAEAETAPAAEEAATEEAPAAPRQSLFAKLDKPKN